MEAPKNTNSVSNLKTKLLALVKQSSSPLVISFVTVVLAFVMALVFQYFRFDRLVEELELKTYDLRATAHWGNQRDEPSPDIVIIKFDDLTLNMFEPEYGTWPWPREIHSHIIKFLHNIGARTIIFDMMFTSNRKGEEASDQALADAFKTHKNVFFSMNLDNNLQLFEMMGRRLSESDWNMLKPLQVDVDNELDPNSKSVKLNATRFFDNDAENFNHFRALYPQLMAVGERIAMINHGRDADGISRGNPLIFRLSRELPVQTDALPLEQVVTRNGDKVWLDAKKRSVNEQGMLLDNTGSVVTQTEYSYYPYMALRLLLDLKYPGQKVKMRLTPDGMLEFRDYRIPLSATGQFLPIWRNANFREYVLTREVQHLDEAIARITEMNRKQPSQNLQMDILKVQKLRERYQTIIRQGFSYEPFQEISASSVLLAMEHEREGRLDEKDQFIKASLKNKVVFIGTTALASYDIKSTPVSPMLPGVVIQAQIFENLLENQRFLYRVSIFWNTFITLIICALVGFTCFRIRSANAGMLTSAAIAVTYIVIATVLFKFGYWVNIVMPLLAIVMTVLLSFMIKYVAKNKDYEKTYAMATTDSMTGLYNHRFFQEHMLNQIAQAKRFNSKFSLVLIDIDFFKKFNDSYGHQAGDEVLRCVARKLKSQVRLVDVVARYGGEEMAVVLDRASEQEGLEVAKKLVREIAAEAYPIAEGVFKHVTISVGVATYPTHGSTPAELIEFSDQGLYRAKENGRNQVGAQYDHELPKRAEEDEPKAANDHH